MSGPARQVLIIQRLGPWIGNTGHVEGRLPSEIKENWRLNYTHEVRAEWKRGEQNPLTIQGKQCGTSHTQDEGLLKKNRKQHETETQT